jgi:hypothetical protein
MTRFAVVMALTAVGILLSPRSTPAVTTDFDSFLKSVEKYAPPQDDTTAPPLAVKSLCACQDGSLDGAVGTLGYVGGVALNARSSAVLVSCLVLGFNDGGHENVVVPCSKWVPLAK